jgi:hypothetical protein
MDRAKLTKFLDLLDEIVNEAEGAWSDKRDALLAICDDKDKSNLEEFAGWFESE